LGRSDESVLVSGAIWGALARLLRVSLKAGTAVVLARWLGPSEFGVFTVALSTAALLKLFVDFGVSTSTARFLLKEETSEQNTVKRSVLVICGNLAVVYTLVYLFSDYVEFIIGADYFDRILIPVLVVTLVQVAERYIKKLYEGLRRVDIVSKCRILTNWVSWVLPILVVIFISQRSSYALISKAIGGSLFIFTSIYYLFRVNVNNSGSEVASLEIVKYALPLAVTSASFYVYTHSDILIIQAFGTEAEVGKYGVAVRLVDALHVPAAAIGSASSGFISKAWQKSEKSLKDLLGKINKSIYFIYVPLAVGLIYTSSDIFRVVFGERYQSAYIITYIYTPYIICKAIAAPYSLGLDYMGFAKKRSIAVAVSAISNVSLNLILVPYIEIYGAALSTQITYVPLVLWYMYEIMSIADIKLKNMLSPFYKSLICSVLMYLSIYSLDFLFNVAIFIDIIFGVTVYLSLVLLFGFISGKEINEISEKIIKRNE